MNPGKKIYCAGCNTYLGIIRDAKLRKNIKFLCKNCETRRMALEMQKMGQRVEPPINNPRKAESSSVTDLFGGVFKK